MVLARSSGFGCSLWGGWEALKGEMSAGNSSPPRGLFSKLSKSYCSCLLQSDPAQSCGHPRLWKGTSASALGGAPCWRPKPAKASLSSPHAVLGVGRSWDTQTGSWPPEPLRGSIYSQLPSLMSHITVSLGELAGPWSQLNTWMTENLPLPEAICSIFFDSSNNFSLNCHKRLLLWIPASASLPHLYLVLFHHTRLLLLVLALGLQTADSSPAAEQPPPSDPVTTLLLLTTSATAARCEQGVWAEGIQEDWKLEEGCPLLSTRLHTCVTGLWDLSPRHLFLLQLVLFAALPSSLLRSTQMWYVVRTDTVLLWYFSVFFLSLDLLNHHEDVERGWVLYFNTTLILTYWEIHPLITVLCLTCHESVKSYQPACILPFKVQLNQEKLASHAASGHSIGWGCCPDLSVL